MADIFISYSSKDRAQAEQLTELLASAGLSVWIDKQGIGGAESWSKEIANALTGCSMFVVLLSAHSLDSHNVRKELSVAAELRKSILPLELERVALQDEFLYHLAGLHKVSITDTQSILKAIEKARVGNTTIELLPAEPRADTSLRLAVLPFEDLSPGHDHEWFADGMMNELINTLGSLGGKIVVSPRTDVIYYKGKKPKLAELSADLKCRYIVEGGVQKSGESIRIRVSLSDAREQKQMWNGKYDGTFDDIFDLQDKTCLAIAEALSLHLTPADEQQIERRQTENVDAYELFLKGVEYFHRQSREGTEHMLSLSEEASRLDPQFAGAYANQADACIAMYQSYDQDPALLKKAQQAIDNLRIAEGETARYFGLTSSLAYVCGDPDRALEAAKQSIKIDPKYGPGYQDLALVYQLTDKPDEALAAWEQAVALRENYRHTHFDMLSYMTTVADRERVRAAAIRAKAPYERHLRFTPDDLSAHGQYISILDWAGERDAALAAAEKFVRNERIDGTALFNLACFYCGCGLYENAMRMLERSVKSGFRNPAPFHNDPEIAPLRTMPEFRKLMETLEEVQK